MKSIDLSGQKLITARDIEAASKSGATELLVQAGSVLTPSARDLIHKSGVVLKSSDGTAGAAASNAAARENNLEQATLAYGRPKSNGGAAVRKPANTGRIVVLTKNDFFIM